MKIDMKNAILQKIVDLSAGLITKMVNAELPKLSQYFDQVVKNLNTQIANEGPLTFAVPVYKDISINLAMAQAPDLKTHDLIKVYFNGLILANNKTSQTIDGIQTPPRLEHSLSEQIWIHERMVDSLLDAVAGDIFPLTVADEGITGQIKQLFPEINAAFGRDANVTLKVTLQTGEGQSINFDMENGIVLGDKSDVKTTIEVVCSNATVTNQTAFTIEMNLEAHVNLTVLAFVVYPDVKQVYVANAAVTQDNIGMYAHDYNKMFTSILHNYANDINMKYAQGFPLANIDPVFGLLGGLLQNFTVSPFFSQDFLLLGFSMAPDMPTAVRPMELKQFLQ